MGKIVLSETDDSKVVKIVLANIIRDVLVCLFLGLFVGIPLIFSGLILPSQEFYIWFGAIWIIFCLIVPFFMANKAKIKVSKDKSKFEIKWFSYFRKKSFVSNDLVSVRANFISNSFKGKTYNLRFIFKKGDVYLEKYAEMSAPEHQHGPLLKEEVEKILKFLEVPYIIQGN
jgi:hypothetical protein